MLDRVILFEVQGKIKLIRSLFYIQTRKGGISEKLIKELASTGLSVDPKTLSKKDGDDNSEIYPRDDDEYSIEHEENLIEDIDIEQQCNIKL